MTWHPKDPEEWKGEVDPMLAFYSPWALAKLRKEMDEIIKRAREQVRRIV